MGSRLFETIARFRICYLSMHTSPQNFQPQSPTISSGWEDRLRDSATATEVVDVARDFVASWTPTELARLPRECRPRKLVDSDDITGFAYALTQRSCALDRMSDDSLHRMASFFTAASRQLASLFPPPDSSAAAEPSRQ